MAQDSDQRNWGRYAGIGLETVVGVVLGILVGQWLDKKFHWRWATIIGAFVGLAVGLYLLIRDAIRMNKD